MSGQNWREIWDSLDDEIQVGDPVTIGARGIPMAAGPELTVLSIERGMAKVQSESGGVHLVSFEVLMPHPAAVI